MVHGFDPTLFCAYIERTHLERRAVSEHARGKFDLYKRAGLGDSLPNIYRESVLAVLWCEKDLPVVYAHGCDGLDLRWRAHLQVAKARIAASLVNLYLKRQREVRWLTCANDEWANFRYELVG